MDNEKRAFKAGASGKWKSYEEWKNTQVEEQVPFEEVLSVVDTWNEQGVFNTKAQKPKPGSPAARTIAKAISKMGYRKCLEAIRNYAEVLDSPYFFNYEWNIKMFFDRTFGASEFTNNGSKFTSYLRWTEANPLKYSQLKDRQLKNLKAHIAVAGQTILNKRKGQDLNIEAAKAQMYPIIFCAIAKQKKVKIDTSVNNPYDRSSFTIHFNDIVVKGSNNSTKTIQDYEGKFNQLIK